MNTDNPFLPDAPDPLDSRPEKSATGDYILNGHHTHTLPLKALYAEAVESLLIPVPSTPLVGFPFFNEMTGGFRPFEFSILCGSTGSGKTTLCANISSALIQSETPHFVASVETGHLDFIRRIMSAKAKKDWNRGDPVPVAEIKAFHVEHADHFQNDLLQLSLYDNRLSVEVLMSDIADSVEKYGTKIAIIDNLSFILETTTSANQILEMDRVIHEIVIFCKRINIHVIMVMHPRKTESGRIESENDIKGSSTANQEAHNIFLWNRPHPELIKAGTAKENDRELLIAKMRRRGKYVRDRLIMRTIDGVTYEEVGVV